MRRGASGSYWPGLRERVRSAPGIWASLRLRPGLSRGASRRSAVLEWSPGKVWPDPRESVDSCARGPASLQWVPGVGRPAARAFARGTSSVGLRVDMAAWVEVVGAEADVFWLAFRRWPRRRSEVVVAVGMSVLVDSTTLAGPPRWARGTAAPARGERLGLVAAAGSFLGDMSRLGVPPRDARAVAEELRASGLLWRRRALTSVP